MSDNTWVIAGLLAPLADTNGKRDSRGSLQRKSFKTPQGRMNVANFTANVSCGLADSARCLRQVESRHPHRPPQPGRC